MTRLYNLWVQPAPIHDELLFQIITARVATYADLAGGHPGDLAAGPTTRTAVGGLSHYGLTSLGSGFCDDTATAQEIAVQCKIELIFVPVTVACHEHGTPVLPIRGEDRHTSSFHRGPMCRDMKAPLDLR